MQSMPPESYPQSATPMYPLKPQVVPVIPDSNAGGPYGGAAAYPPGPAYPPNPAYSPGPGYPPGPAYPPTAAPAQPPGTYTYYKSLNRSPRLLLVQLSQTPGL